MLLNCGVEKALESPLDCKKIQWVHPKRNQSWIFTGNTDAEAEAPILWPPWCDELTDWKRPWCWERLKSGGEGDDRGWYGWMASPTQWTWVWVSSRSWWWTGKPGMLQSMGSQRVRHDWVTELIDWLCWAQLCWCRLTMLDGCAVSPFSPPNGHLLENSHLLGHLAWPAKRLTEPR